MLPVSSDQHITIMVSGYWFAGDGGAKVMFWDPWCQQPDNNGTFIASEHHVNGRWRQIHQGELDFRQFGIFNGEHSADEALDAMVNDPEVFIIRARTSLNFMRRHTFSRSGITLDFGGQTVSVVGIQDADPMAPYLSAVMLFTGSVSGETVTTPLIERLPELSDVYPVTLSRDFDVGSWYRLESAKRKGQSERIIQRLVQVTERVGQTSVRVNYKTGYELPDGEILYWTPISPVRDVNITDMKFIATGTFADKGAHPLALEYAINCNVRRIQAEGTFWPVVFRRWNTHYRTEQCSLINPPTTRYGGAGYLTQQISCLYGHVSDCTAANARHLNDFTASAYCRVENCHATGDSAGAFTTHGQYEHDLLYQGNSGILSLANSGYQWGLSARRIRIEQHVCTMLLADTFISDLTLTDVHIRRSSSPGGPGIFRANCDGLQMRGCQIDGEFTLVSATANSDRRNLIAGCSVRLDNRHDLTISNLDRHDPFITSHPTSVSRNSVNGPGVVTFSHCDFKGNNDTASWWFIGGNVQFSGCHFHNLSLLFTAIRPQKIVFSGENEMEGPGHPTPLIARAGHYPIIWKITGLTSRTAAPEGVHININTGENSAYICHSEFYGGLCLFNRAAFSQYAPLHEENNFYLEGCSVEWQDGPHQQKDEEHVSEKF